MQENNKNINKQTTKSCSEVQTLSIINGKEVLCNKNESSNVKFSDMLSFVLTNYKNLLKGVYIDEISYNMLYEIFLIQCKHDKKFYFSSGSDFQLNNMLSDLIDTISNQDVEVIYNNFNFIKHVSNHFSMSSFMFKSMQTIACLSKSIENECFSSIVKFIYCSYITITYFKNHTIKEIKEMIVDFEMNDMRMMDIDNLTLNEKSVDLYLNSLRTDFYELYELISLEGFLRYGGIIDFTYKMELENKVELFSFYNKNKKEFELRKIFPAIMNYIENFFNVDVDFDITQEQFEIQKRIEVDMMLFEYLHTKVGYLGYFLNSFMVD